MTKATVTLLLWEHKMNKHGQHPIYLRITVNGKRSYIATGKHTTSRYWDAKNECVRDTVKDAALINADLQAKKTEALRKIHDDQITGKVITATGVKRTVATASGGNDFFAFAAKFTQQSKARKNERTIVNYTSHTKHFQEFVKAIAFEDITPDLLTEYETHLRSLDLSAGYTRILLRHIRIVFNAARKAGVTDYYPFSNFTLPEENAKPKEYLSVEEVKKLERLVHKLSGKPQAALLYFLLGCYTGLRVSDWRTFNPKDAVKDGWVRTVARKNKTWVSMPIPPGLGRLLPLFETIACITHEQQINETLGRILPEQGITRHITTHSARKTFAISMCADRGIGCEVAAELMGITVAVAVKHYYSVTNYKIEREVKKAWRGL